MKKGNNPNPPQYRPAPPPNPPIPPLVRGLMEGLVQKGGVNKICYAPRPLPPKGQNAN